MNGGRQSPGGSSAVDRSPPWPIRTDGGDPEDDPDPTDRPADDESSPDDGATDSSDDRSHGEEAVDEGESADDGDRQSVIRDQREEIHRLRTELRDLEDRVDRKSVDRDDLEGDLERYVRWRQRRGYARNWGPYLVLLYGVVLTLAAFQTPHLYNGWTILAMIVVWLSTLGLYALMLVVGWGLTTTAWLGAARSAIERTR